MSNTMHRKLMTAAITAVLAASAWAGAYAGIPKPLITIRKLPPGVTAAEAVWEQPPTVGARALSGGLVAVIHLQTHGRRCEHSEQFHALPATGGPSEQFEPQFDLERRSGRT